MLRLYKDPEGTTVFSAHEEVSAVPVNSTVQGGNQDLVGDLQEENDNLKKKVKQLEDTITEYQVHNRAYTQAWGLGATFKSNFHIASSCTEH